MLQRDGENSEIWQKGAGKAPASQTPLLLEAELNDSSQTPLRLADQAVKQQGAKSLPAATGLDPCVLRTELMSGGTLALVMKDMNPRETNALG